MNNREMNNRQMTSEQKEWQLRASIALDAAIAGGHLITYAELADAARIPAPHRIHKLTSWLETLLEDDHHAARPLRAAWVVSRHREQVPAPGFFMKCQDLGIYDGAPKGQQAADFHRRLLAQSPA